MQYASLRLSAHDWNEFVQPPLEPDAAILAGLALMPDEASLAAPPTYFQQPMARLLRRRQGARSMELLVDFLVAVYHQWKEFEQDHTGNSVLRARSPTPIIFAVIETDVTSR